MMRKPPLLQSDGIMTTRFTCAAGHEWETPEAAASGAAPRCPVCASLYTTPPRERAAVRADHRPRAVQSPPARGLTPRAPNPASVLGAGGGGGGRGFTPPVQGAQDRRADAAPLANLTAKITDFGLAKLLD